MHPAVEPRTALPRPNERQPTVVLGKEDARVERGLLPVYLLLGLFFGVVLIKSEVVSWFRIQEMFRFQSIHMYGVLGSAVAVASLSVWLIRRLGVTTLRGEPIMIAPKENGHIVGPLVGGTIFGLGWGLLGACPGPIYALIGSGVTVMVVALVSAVAGAWVYGHLRPKLPH